MGLDIHSMVQANSVDEYECSLCGACVDICPKKAITYGVKKACENK
ncbi:4Fe-4S binding protein [Anaerovorax odorimutans]